jgi:Uma2 family endonuclease
MERVAAMTIEEMKQRKKELGYSYEKISELSGVPVGTLQKIFSGETSSPRYKTIMALSNVLGDKGDIYEVHESAGAYNANYIKGQKNETSTSIYEGEKTLDDYLALPEGTRIELIDGKFYDMAAPTTIHQSIGFEICYLFKKYVSKNGGKCVPFIAPTDVQLDCDNRTMVQPDVLVVCDRNKITRARIVGAPDLVVEVVSPTNMVTDVMIKLFKYKNAGVREYWIVYPDEKRVTVFDFEKDIGPKDYSFEDTIPVAIWDGDCKIDFSYIYSQIEFMY